MRKKVIAILLSVTMTAALLAGCGNSGSTSEPAPEQTEDAAQTRLQKEILRQLREPRPLKVRAGGGVKSSLAAP